MSIMDPPWGTGLGDAVAASDPLRVAIARAAARLDEAGAQYVQDFVGSPDVAEAVRSALNMTEDLNTDPQRRAFASFFLETVAGLAITRAASDMDPLTEEQLAEVRESLCEKLRVFVESP